MLTHIHIQNFTLVDTLDLEVRKGLTSITGETGAGKSIMLDAIGLSIGDRADPEKVRIGADKADIQTTFDISQLNFAKKWLEKHELTLDDNDNNECMLRRVVTSEGRSRAYINGRPATLQQLKSLGRLLIDIHNQHEHQSLMQASTHRRLLDDFAGVHTLVEQVKNDFKNWQQINDKLQALQNQSDEVDARFQLLSYQVNELDQLALEQNELEALEEEQKALANIESTQEACAHLADICSNENAGLKNQLHTALHTLRNMAVKSKALKETEELLSQALIQVDEAHNNIESEMDHGENDASRLPEIENRLSTIYDLARKHRIKAEALYDFHQELAEELSQLNNSEGHIDALEKELTIALEHYKKSANKLSSKRSSASKKLASEVNKKLKQLAMTHAQFAIDLPSREENFDRHGLEDTAFLISTNPGQQPKALAKVASGGELSRVSLAIQVVTAQTSTTPTLVFDEVDVGIGGVTGHEVGSMLRELGNAAQVFCVTHLAQVASKAHQHLLVSKATSKKEANSTLEPITGQDVITEIARMMGGASESKQSIAHAKQMLEAV